MSRSKWKKAFEIVHEFTIWLRNSYLVKIELFRARFPIEVARNAIIFIVPREYYQIINPEAA